MSRMEVVEEWWASLTPDKKEIAVRHFFEVRFNNSARQLILSSVVAPVLTADEKAALQNHGAVPKDVLKFIMRHD